jgi:hypothetical protein
MFVGPPTQGADAVDVPFISVRHRPASIIPRRTALSARGPKSCASVVPSSLHRTDGPGASCAARSWPRRPSRSRSRRRGPITPRSDPPPIGRGPVPRQTRRAPPIGPRATRRRSAGRPPRSGRSRAGLDSGRCRRSGQRPVELWRRSAGVGRVGRTSCNVGVGRGEVVLSPLSEDHRAALPTAGRLDENRGDSICTFVIEVAGSRLVRQVVPQTLEFHGDEVLQFVRAGLYRKRSDRG